METTTVTTVMQRIMAPPMETNIRARRPLNEKEDGIVLEPLAQALIAGGVINGYAPESVKSTWLPKISAGEALIVLAHQERKARYRLDACETQATPAGSAWSVTGAKSVVPAGDTAEAFLVPALANGKIALFLVERAASGVTTRGYGEQDCIDLANWICDVLDAPSDEAVLAKVRENVTAQCRKYPVYG